MKKYTLLINSLLYILNNNRCQNSEAVHPELSEPAPIASFYANNLSARTSDNAIVICGGQSIHIQSNTDDIGSGIKHRKTIRLFSAKFNLYANLPTYYISEIESKKVD